MQSSSRGVRFKECPLQLQKDAQYAIHFSILKHIYANQFCLVNYSMLMKNFTYLH